MKEDYYVIFSSVTIATNVKKHLEQKGITAVLMHTPKSLQLNGCSYSLKVKKKDYSEAVATAESSGATVIAVYCSDCDGFREVET